MVNLALPKDEVERYSRQILVDQIGVKGHKGISGGSVLIIGVGGLGSPASLYLAAAGVGKLGLVDYDTVDLSNLHRQVIHREESVGIRKVESAKKALHEINSKCEIETFDCLISSQNALQIVQNYDVVLDCSDNAVTRYLINDACVMLGKPLVSGAALRMDGQLSTYNFKGSACYRCVYPMPPNAELVVNCDVGGVLGPITGTIGSLQALEALRILSAGQSNYVGKLLLFNGAEGTFRSLKLRPRRADCAVCGDSPSIGKTLIDYEIFCGSKANDKTRSISVLPPDQRISPEKFTQLDESKVVLIDVRPAIQFEIFSLENSINIPIERFENSISNVKELLKGEKQCIVVCRRGNDSQLAVEKLRSSGIIQSYDIIGGLLQIAKTVEKDMPIF